jgi:hypothetical protein
MKGGRVREFSFAYAVTDGSPQTKDGDSFFEIRGVDLYEVGPTPIGANPATELLDLKARAVEIEHQVKAGRTFSKANEAAIRDAIELSEAIADSLKSILPPGDPEAEVEGSEKTSGTEPSTDSTGKSKPDVTTPSPSVALALINIESIEEGE